MRRGDNCCVNFCDYFMLMIIHMRTSHKQQFKNLANLFLSIHVANFFFIFCQSISVFFSSLPFAHRRWLSSTTNTHSHRVLTWASRESGRITFNFLLIAQQSFEKSFCDFWRWLDKKRREAHNEELGKHFFAFQQPQRIFTRIAALNSHRTPFARDKSNWFASQIVFATEKI